VVLREPLQEKSLFLQFRDVDLNTLKKTGVRVRGKGRSQREIVSKELRLATENCRSSGHVPWNRGTKARIKALEGHERVREREGSEKEEGWNREMDLAGTKRENGRGKPTD